MDDDPDIRDLTRLSLELDPDFAVETAASGAEALRCIEKAIPELILLDVMMPEMDGRSLMRILKNRSETSDIPVVFMTALTGRSLLDELRALGAVGIISKPFDPIALADDLKILIQDDLERAS